jgi:hypothetical protein
MCRKNNLFDDITCLGYRNTGDRNTGDRNTGDRNTGDGNTGNCNTGDGNTGDRNTGDGNTGYRNTGDCNTGYFNTGDCNTGDGNTGDRNTGDWNTGDRNTGYRNTGDRNTGDWNTGDRNTGAGNTGDRNTGDCNTGDRNTGDWNTGYRNTGDRNTGDWNTGDRNTGYFNTQTPENIIVFNSPCAKSAWDVAYKPLFLFFTLHDWVYENKMTDQEKIDNPTFFTCGGYLKKIDYKDAFIASWENADHSDRIRVKDLPNFDADIFYEISGIDLRENVPKKVKLYFNQYRNSNGEFTYVSLGRSGNEESVENCHAEYQKTIEVEVEE